MAVPACRPQLLAQAAPEGWRGPLGSAQRPRAPCRDPVDARTFSSAGRSRTLRGSSLLSEEQGMRALGLLQPRWALGPQNPP